MAQDLLLQVLQSRTWLDPEFVDQRRAGRPVRIKRLGLPPAAVERQHEKLVSALAERMLTRKRLNVRQDVCVTAPPELRLEQPLADHQPEVL